MRNLRSRAVGAALLVLAIVAGACGSGDGASPVVIGSANFSESTLVAEIYAQALEANDITVERKLNLGSREITTGSLESGELSLMPEYVGGLSSYLGGTPTADVDASVEELAGLAADSGIVVLDPAPAQDSDGLAVRAETADELGLVTISDLQPVAGDLVFGGPPECPDRPYCLAGYEGVYGLEFAEFVALDSGGPLTRTAITSEEIDVAHVFTTLAWIAAEGLVVLEDDQGLNPAQNLIPALNAELLDEYGGADGELATILDEVSAALTTEDLTALNARVEIDGIEPADVAAEWLEENGLLGG